MRLRLFLTSAILALAACNAGDPPAPAAPDGPAVANIAGKSTAPPQTANAQQPALKVDEVEFQTAPEPAQAADPNAVTRAWFAGRWTDTGDCAQAGEFGANGMYLLADGTRGMWNIVDGRLIVQHAGGRGSVAVRKVDEHHVEVVNDDGSVGRSARC
ncbi:MAG: hypothetical protein ABW128_00835 [Rhizorhabdus sp.]